jgi:VIT1/CCC1 family predicted Fe2+/Mn2+ transporter
MTQRRDRFREVYLRPSVLGAIDGLITSFVIVASGFASNASMRVITLIGFSSLVADGISMGVSELLSSRAQNSDLTLRNASLQGLTCFAGFVSFGSMPLVGYTVGQTDLSRRLLSILLFLGFLTIVGVLRAWVARQSVVVTVAEIVCVGSLAGGVAYGIASI